MTSCPATSLLVLLGTAAAVHTWQGCTEWLVSLPLKGWQHSTSLCLVQQQYYGAVKQRASLQPLHIHCAGAAGNPTARA
jgi:hypothetical protein